MDLVRAIGDCRSKQEEDAIVGREVLSLRARVANAQAQGQMRELIIRMMYCEMLGHRVEFGYIHAVNMTQRPALTEKRTGYLATTLFLDSSSELLILLVNTLQKDLKSTNKWEVCAALSAAGRLVGADTIEAVLKLVKDLVQHKEAHVRKKVLIALHGFLQKSPESLQGCVDIFKRSLSDRDPSVMAAGLNGLFDLAKKDPRTYTSVVPSVVVILKQVVERRLPTAYDYHKMPAPWLQIKLLKLLAILGYANQRASEEMYEVLRQTMQASELKTTIGYAVMFECIKTIAKIYPQEQLLAAAAENTSRFMTSENRNLRYIGIDALSAIVSVNPEHAKEHQMVVVDCLEDPDDTFRRKTLDLLFAMTNAQNAEFVVARMSGYLEAASDEFLKRDFVGKITTLAEKFAPSNGWYIQTMNSVFERGGDLVSLDVAHNFMRLIAEGPSGDEDQDNQLRAYACRSYVTLLPKSGAPDRLVQVGSWTLGEYAHLLAPEIDMETVLAILCDLLQRSYYQDSTTKCFIVSALTKLVAQNPGGCPAMVQTLVARYCSARDPALQQRCLELKGLMQVPALMRKVLPVDASCEDIEVDVSLPMLHGYVQRALQAGAQRYMDEGQRAAAGINVSGFSTAGSASTSGQAAEGSKLRFDAYAEPQLPPATINSAPQAAATPNPLISELAAPNPEKSAAANALFAGLTTVGGGPAAGDAQQPAVSRAPQVASGPNPAGGMSHAASSSGAGGDVVVDLGLSGLASGAAGRWSSAGFASASDVASSSGGGAQMAASTAGSAHVTSAGADVQDWMLGAASNRQGGGARSLTAAQPSAEELKKKQMAASLFGGMTVTPASSAATAAPARGPAASNRTPAVAEGSIFADLSVASSHRARQDASSVDLLDTTWPARAASASASGLDDLLGMAAQQPAHKSSLSQGQAAHAADPLQGLLSIPTVASSSNYASGKGNAGILEDLGMDGGLGAGGRAVGAGTLGSHEVPALHAPANPSSSSSLLMDLQSTLAPGGANVGQHNGGLAQGAAAAGGSLLAAQAPAGGMAAELRSVYGAAAPMQGSGGAGEVLNRGSAAAVGPGRASMFGDISAPSIVGATMPAGMGGNGGIFGDAAGVQASASHAMRPSLPTPDSDMFAGLGGLSGGITASGQGLNGASGSALDGMLGTGVVREPSAGMGGSSTRGLPLPDVSDSGISAFGALLNPAPPPPPEVSYNWALSPPMLASVGATPAAQPEVRVIHTSDSTGIETAALARQVGDQARLLLQFRESRGASGSGLQAAVRYQLPAHVQVEYLGEPVPVLAADGSVALPPLPWPRGVTHVVCLKGAPVPAGGEHQLRVRVALTCDTASDVFEVGCGLLAPSTLSLPLSSCRRPPAAIAQSLPSK